MYDIIKVTHLGVQESGDLLSHSNPQLQGPVVNSAEQDISCLWPPVGLWFAHTWDSLPIGEWPQEEYHRPWKRKYRTFSQGVLGSWASEVWSRNRSKSLGSGMAISGKNPWIWRCGWRRMSGAFSSVGPRTWARVSLASINSASQFCMAMVEARQLWPASVQVLAPEDQGRYSQLFFLPNVNLS